MTREDIENLALGVGMIRTQGDLIKPLWTASDAQIAKLVETVVKEVKQNASEYVVRAIKKAVEYERAECAKLVEADGVARGNEGLVLIKAAGRIRARSEND